MKVFFVVVIPIVSFYVQEKRLKELFNNIPTPEDLHALGAEGSRADVILVDFKKDKKLSMLKQLAKTLVKGLNSNPAAMIKKLAGLVSMINFTFVMRSLLLLVFPYI